MDSDEKYIKGLIRRTKNSIRFISNEMKPEKERSVVIFLLRCLGVNFKLSEIIANSDDPPDVIFRNAKFEVTELYDSRRKRLDEFRKRLKKLESVKSIDDTLLFVKEMKPISYAKLFEHISDVLKTKEEKYGAEVCMNLDALVYIGLPNTFLDIKSELKPDNNKTINQVWKSVSFVIPPFGHVIYCAANAPKFLKDLFGNTKSEWKDPDSFFDI